MALAGLVKAAWKIRQRDSRERKINDEEDLRQPTTLLNSMPPSVQDAEVVVKRRRGRPPSTNKAVAAPKVATVEKRGRGRPPTDRSQQVEKASGEPGKRGRPRIYPVDYLKVEKLALLLAPLERDTLAKKLAESVQRNWFLSD